MEGKLAGKREGYVLDYRTPRMRTPERIQIAGKLNLYFRPKVLALARVSPFPIHLRDEFFLFVTGSADGDFARVFQLANDIDDLLLHRFDI